MGAKEQKIDEQIDDLWLGLCSVQRKLIRLKSQAMALGKTRTVAHINDAVNSVVDALEFVDE